MECAESNRPKEFAAEQEWTDGKDDMELIQHIVDHLPPLQQQVFQLKEIDGYENEEIAKIIQSHNVEIVKTPVNTLLKDRIQQK